MGNMEEESPRNPTDTAKKIENFQPGGRNHQKIDRYQINPSQDTENFQPGGRNRQKTG